MSNQKQYDGPPSTFVNVKRVKRGEDSKQRETLTVTFGLTKDKEGNEVNTLDNLIEALTALQGRQANITIHMEEKDGGNGRSFLSAFARVTEMIPRAEGGGPSGGAKFTPKTNNRQADVQQRAASIRQNFKG